MAEAPYSSRRHLFQKSFVKRRRIQHSKLDSELNNKGKQRLENSQRNFPRYRQVGKRILHWHLRRSPHYWTTPTVHYRNDLFPSSDLTGGDVGMSSRCAQLYVPFYHNKCICGALDYSAIPRLSAAELNLRDSRPIVEHTSALLGEVYIWPDQKRHVFFQGHPLQRRSGRTRPEVHIAQLVQFQSL